MSEALVLLGLMGGGVAGLMMGVKMEWVSGLKVMEGVAGLKIWDVVGVKIEVVVGLKVGEGVGVEVEEVVDLKVG